MTYPSLSSRGRFQTRSITALLCLLALGTASTPTLAEQPVPDLLTAVGGWEKSETLESVSTAAVEGLAVEIRSDLLTRGQDRLAFQDFYGRYFEAELDRIERAASGATTWVGRVAEFGDHSQVLLTTYEGAVAGYFDTPEGRYEVVPRPGGHVMIQLDASRFAGCGTSEKHDHPVSDATFDRAAESLGVDPWEVRQRSGETSEIEILVLTTATSVAASGGDAGARVIAENAVAILDTAFEASGVNATASVAGWEKVSADKLGDSSGGNDGLVHAIYSNGSGLQTALDQTWHHGLASLGQAGGRFDEFGKVLAAGDFDGDGRDDLAIGVPRKGFGSKSFVGGVQILYGTQYRLKSAGAQFIHQDTPGVNGGNETGDHFGFALAVGDFDDDGYDDLAIGAPYEGLDGADKTGRVLVMYGSADGISTSGELSIEQRDLSEAGPDEDNDNFGRALAAGDFDGDGYDDLAIGISEEDWGGDNNLGRVAVVYGDGGGLDPNDDQIFDQDTSGLANSSEGGDRFGRSLAAGDFDGDGYDDLAVGSPWEDTGGKDDAGVIHVLFGTGSGLTGSGSQYFNQGNLGGGTENDDHFGYAMTVGDFNGDGNDDLAVSAPFENSNDAGRVHVLFGSQTAGLNPSNYFMTGGSGEQFGRALAAGDFDNDGYDDLAVGRPGADGDDVTNSGAITIYEGSSTAATTAMTSDGEWSQETSGILEEAEDDDDFGRALATGDFDGDGDIDLVVGASGETVANDASYFLSWIKSSSLVSAWRSEHSADLVGLITENLDGICGRGYVLGSVSGNSNTAYQVTKRSCAVGNLSFAHEIGHNLGLTHNPENGSGGACTYARGHYESGVARTLMSYSNPCDGGCTRVALLSNPDVDFDSGDASGIEDERDNARCANRTVDNVADYR